MRRTLDFCRGCDVLLPVVVLSKHDGVAAIVQALAVMEESTVFAGRRLCRACTTVRPAVEPWPTLAGLAGAWQDPRGHQRPQAAGNARPQAPATPPRGAR